MTAGQQWRVVGAIVALLGGALWFASYQLKDELVGVDVGSEAPMFAGATVAGPVRAKSLADYKGKVVLLNVWATWCGPCRTEMPSIEALHKEMGPKGLHVVAVSIDDPGKADDIRKFLKDFNLTFEVLHDSTQAIQKAYQTTGVPETFVIAADGTIRKKVIAAADWNSAPNRALITQLLKDAGA
ncbi:MAG: TlpA disulfide reductase family protein [Gemmatimonadaceae bacterium]|nr:TlpA disulfide reductase family protein [Gemmatimonadaceae bacterium]